VIKLFTDQKRNPMIIDSIMCNHFGAP